MENKVKNNKTNFRCGDCMFAEGGDVVEFRNGETNVKYKCTLISRNDNIVFLDNLSENYRWQNQKACKHFEGIGKILKKRDDLDNEKLNSSWEGYYEILKYPPA